MLAHVGIDVADSLLCQYLIDSDEDARLLHAAELIVDGGAEDLHGGRKAHVGVDQRRDVESELPDLAVEQALVGLEILLGEDGGKIVGIGVDE